MKIDIKNSLYIITGILLLAAGINIFYVPNELVSGGVSGLGIIILNYSEKYLGFPISVSLTNILFNIPLFIIAYFLFGKKYIKRSIFASLFFSAALRVTEIFPEFYGDLMLASIFGGIIAGTGVGLIFNGSATTGGTETAAHILHEINDRFSVSDYIFIIDAIVIMIGFFTFGAEKTMYAIISVFAASKCIAAVSSGTSGDKAAVVISKVNKEIRETLMSDSSSLLTAVKNCSYDENCTGPLICIFSQNEVSQFKETVKSVDINAFIILFDVKEVYGQGYKKL